MNPSISFGNGFATKSLGSYSTTKSLGVNTNLEKIVKELYRKEASIGSGSTADAARFEIRTGEKVKGSFHIDKTTNYTVSLKKWLKNNPNAAASDRAAAENLIKDMQDALGVKKWYSATITPK